MTKEEKMYVILALAERYNLDVAVSVNVMGIQHKLDNILLRVGSKYFDVFSGELYDRFVFDGSTCACHSDNVKEVKGFLGLHLIKCTDREYLGTLFLYVKKHLQRVRQCLTLFKTDLHFNIMGASKMRPSLYLKLC